MREIRASCGRYGLPWLVAGAGTLCMRIGLSSDGADDRDDVDPRRTRDAAAAASDAAWPPVLGHEAALLVVEAELHPGRAALPEVLPACDRRVALEQARIPDARAAAGATAEIDLVLHVEA